MSDCTWCGHADHGETCTDSIIVANVERVWGATEIKARAKIPTKQIPCPCARPSMEIHLTEGTEVPSALGIAGKIAQLEEAERASESAQA